MADEPMAPELVHELLRRSVRGANELLRTLEAMRLRAHRLDDLHLDQARAERRTRDLRERVLHGLALERARRPRLG